MVISQLSFRNRGHFCNYCRKIIWNKIKDKQFQTININEVIWYAWDNPDKAEEILESIKKLNTDCTNKQFNSQLKALLNSYGFDNQKRTDYERRKHYERNQAQ